MGSSRLPRRKSSCLFIPLVLVGLCLLVAAISALSNLGLPQRSTTVDHLSDLEKARLSEITHLRTNLGDRAWPGWGQADIPLMVYNEQYAFLVGYPDPPDGWLKVPTMEARGGPWEEVPGDTFEDKPYYRTPIVDPQKTPEGFTVLVGERWVATFQTREYSQVVFYRDFHDQLPPGISSLAPLRLVWALLMGKSDSYIAALEHESFHAFQGIHAPGQLAAAESLYQVEETYPFNDMEQAWGQEMDVLVQAAQAGSEEGVRALALQFLGLRTARREQMSPEQVEFERLREWEEGLAKYAELEISRQAEQVAEYDSVPGMELDSDFKQYRGQEQFWTTQLKEAQNTQGRSGGTRFYYSGNALGVVLDRLLPGWKPRALPRGEFLDDLLREAVQ